MNSNQHELNTLVIDRYQLKSLLGQGGMGRTYKAIDLQTQQHVAVKIISLKQINDWKKVEGQNSRIQEGTRRVDNQGRRVGTERSNN